MKYLREFQTVTDYDAAKSTLDLPNVSLITETNGVAFKPYVPPQPITYTASAKLTETTGNYSSGLHTNAFSGTSGQLTITSHTFENGVGTITFDGNVTSIGNNAFYYCSGPTSITIPDSVISIGTEAFEGCTGLTSINIPSGVTSIGYNAFSGCRGLTSVTIGSGVTSIGGSAFSNCSGLTSITIPDNVTYIGQNAFSGCYFTVNNFVNNSSLDEVANNYWGASIYDTNINGLLIRNNVVIKYIGTSNTVTIPNSITSIGRGAFSDSSITSITIPNSVTSIGAYTFQGCSGLTSVTIGSGVTSIGDSAFRLCRSLTSIICNATTAPKISYSTFLDIKKNGKLTVPRGSTGYDVWMRKTSDYLGYYNWTKVEK